MTLTPSGATCRAALALTRRAARRGSSARRRRRRRSSPTGCPADRGRPPRPRRPARRNVSARCRTAVVLPVPPFWLSTAIFSAIGAESRRRRSLPLGGRRAPCEELQAVAPDDDLVAVGQRAPLDALAVDEDAVERPVVEHAHAVGLAHDQRVAARDRRVVEADVGGQAAPDPSPLLLQRRDPRRPGVLVGEVLARRVDHGARSDTSSARSLGARRLAGPAVEAPAGEQRGADEARRRRSPGRPAARRPRPASRRIRTARSGRTLFPQGFPTSRTPYRPTPSLPAGDPTADCTARAACKEPGSILAGRHIRLTAQAGKPCRGTDRLQREDRRGRDEPRPMARTLRTLSEPDLELALLRKSVGSLTARSPLLRRLRTHAAGRRAHVPLRPRVDWSASSARRCAAPSPTPSSSCATSSAATRSAASCRTRPEPPAPGGARHRLRPRGSHHRRSRRSRVLARRSSSTSQTSPTTPSSPTTTCRLAPDARGQLRRRRRRPLQDPGAAATATRGPTRRSPSSPRRGSSSSAAAPASSTAT